MTSAVILSLSEHFNKLLIKLLVMVLMKTIGCITWLSRYTQGMLRNEKESLIPNDCHCGETDCTGYDPNNNEYEYPNNVLLVLIENQFACNGCNTK